MRLIVGVFTASVGALSGLACSSPAGTEPDAPSPDGNVGPDASTSPDASTRPDGNVGPDAPPPPDFDGDGIPDDADPDDDNDGFTDEDEAAHGTDAYDATDQPPDLDGDLVGDLTDEDDDGDDVPDADDAFPRDPIEQLDTDSDALGNNADTDDDNDFALDTADDFPLDATQSLAWDVLQVGINHGCGLRGGRAFCWGDDSVGQLGDGGDAHARPFPVWIDPGRTYLDIWVGDAFTVAQETQRGYYWGHQRPLSRADSPSARFPPGRVSASSDSLCGGVDIAGSASCVGVNDSGKIGNGGIDPFAESDLGSGWTELAPGVTRTCGRGNGQLYCWGDDSFGSLGVGSGGSIVVSPARVGSDSDWSHVAAGAVSFGIRGGALFAWGLGYRGVLGLGPTSLVIAPTQVGSDADWTAISSALGNACGIRAGELYCWGRGDFGAIGVGDLNDRDVPTRVGEFSDWDQVRVSSMAACATRGGTAYCWGLAPMPWGEAELVLEPRQVQVPPWRAVWPGVDTTFATRGAGLFGSGADAFGQLGNGSAGAATNTTRLGAGTWVDVAGGAFHTCAIVANAGGDGTRGALHCTGADFVGQLGLGLGETPSTTYAQVGADTDWTAVEAGNTFTCGIRGGELYCWGENGSGNLGDGTITVGEAPVRVGNDVDWTSVSAGASHACGIRDGALHCWGNDQFQQLGNGDGVQHTTVPMQVGVDTDWLEVAAGNEFTCGRRADGLYCWGEDSSGQLGNGADGMASSPRRISAEVDWEGLTAGAVHACARRGGALYCWGGDGEGQLGNDASLAHVQVPTQVGSSTRWRDVAAGGFTTCGIDAGSLACWGRDDTGQLGDGGANTSRPEPVYVSRFWGP